MPAEVQSMFYAGEVPWHRFGTQVADALLTPEALVKAGLGYSTSKVPLFERLADGTMREVPGVYGMRRSDTGHSFADVAVGDKYRPISHDALLGICDALSTTGQVRWETAGALFDGRRVWALGRAPGAFTVRGSDTVLPYILAYTSHDGSSCTELRFTSVRCVCWNTVSMARSAKAGFKIRHTAGQEDRLAEAAKALSLAGSHFAESAEIANELAAKRMALTEFIAFATELLDVPEDPQGRSKTLAERKVLTLAEAFTSGLGNSGQTRWDALNAVTQVVDHQELRAKVARVKGLSIKAFESALFGHGDQLKTRAVEMLRK